MAILPRDASTDNVLTMLVAARADGATVALMTEEDFTGGAGPGEAIDGPHITTVRAHAKAVGIAVICPMRLLLGAAGSSWSVNAAVVVHANGSVATAAHTAANHYQKQYPVYGWPVGPGERVQDGEIPITPGQTGVQVWDMPGIGRIAVSTVSYLDTRAPVVPTLPPKITTRAFARTVEAHLVRATASHTRPRRSSPALT